MGSVFGQKPENVPFLAIIIMSNRALGGTGKANMCTSANDWSFEAFAVGQVSSCGKD